MKTYLFIVIISLSNYALCQTPDFSAYSRITNPDFEAFVNLFSSKNLPIESQDIRNSSFQDLGVKTFTESMINSFLKVNGEYMLPKLYTLQDEDSTLIDRYGNFFSVCKLPTNGDYVLLVIYQIDGPNDWFYRSWVLSYDLNGNFLKIIGNGFLTSGVDNYISCSINSQLEFIYNYVNITPNDRSSWLNCNPCNNHHTTNVYQILNSGLDTLSTSTDNGTATFNYNGYFFEQQ
ncbi:MAG: hypothetical protein OEW75_17020 [Cyclobacteriaceae bacterium]|nr:hypothetical protein [Cyclobacteriaceae bacterium]